MYPNSFCNYPWQNPMHYYGMEGGDPSLNPYYYGWHNSYHHPQHQNNKISDYGPRPLVVNIEQVTKQNNTYRTALWTGKYYQVTLMCINVGDDIGLEVHPTTDQFIRIEEGQGLVQMGDSKDNLNFQAMACKDYAIMIPAGKWHNITNTGNTPLKVYVIYAPPEHPRGTVHVTKAEAMLAER